MANNIIFQKSQLKMTLSSLPIDNVDLVLYDDFVVRNDSTYVISKSLRTESREFMFTLQESDIIAPTIQYNFFGR